MLTTTGGAKPETTIRMRDRAPVGEPIQLTIRVHNPDEIAVTVPDLTNRPWLVIFETTDPSGVQRTLFSTPPISDPGQRWAIGPGERREAHFQVPTSRQLGQRGCVGSSHRRSGTSIQTYGSPL
jgi:hypothetical protein